MLNRCVPRSFLHENRMRKKDGTVCLMDGWIAVNFRDFLQIFEICRVIPVEDNITSAFANFNIISSRLIGSEDSDTSWQDVANLSGDKPS